mmetsp:Transcript_425/g.1065  ORF Transcript_425/g.1065 Transcript_425/m.1065 type:complete len:201 (-) Transcript_425:73-675(-)
MIGLHHVEGLVSTSFRCEIFVVNNISTVGRKSYSVSYLIGFRTRFGELPCHAAYLDDGHGGSKGQHERHLKQNTEGIANVIDIKFVKGFRTIPTHQQKTLPAAGTGQLLVQCSDFSGKDQGRRLFKLCNSLLVFFLVFVFRRLRTALRLPRSRRPSLTFGSFCCDIQRYSFSCQRLWSESLRRANSKTKKRSSNRQFHCA